MMRALKRSVSRSISLKLMMVVLATTFMALLVSAVAILAYDLSNHRSTLLADLDTQAELVASMSAPAIAYGDARTAQEYLELLRLRPMILAAALYDPDGKPFSTYLKQGGNLPDRFDLESYDAQRIRGNRIVTVRPIVESEELIGVAYLEARYDIWERLLKFLAILIAAMAASVGMVILMLGWIHGVLSKPVLRVAAVAREVMYNRDFSLRAEKTTVDEIGILVDAFNAMLDEVGRRNAEMEKSNRILEKEMKERRGAEQALLNADRRKDEFLATLAHELRNPLAPLLNGLAILRLEADNSAGQVKAREIMERQIKQMVRLVDDLLDVSRITVGKLMIQVERVLLQSIVLRAVEMNSGLLTSKGQHLDLLLPEQEIWLDADAIRLAQVFSNLLNNAAKYSPANARIEISAQVRDGQALIRVSDQGIGIDHAMLDSVFDMFMQVDTSLERGNVGLGVGLTLARKLVELHNGSLEAVSAGLGQGSTFCVRLPLAALQAPSEHPSVPAHTRAQQRQFKIILADDNVDFVLSMATLLEAQGHQVLVSHDGADALARAGDFAPDFAFLDIGLPKLNGYQLARGLRSLESTRCCILVAVTGWGQTKDKDQARAAGFDLHLVKPVAFAQIDAILQQR